MSWDSLRSPHTCSDSGGLNVRGTVLIVRSSARLAAAVVSITCRRGLHARDRVGVLVTARALCVCGLEQERLKVNLPQLCATYSTYNNSSIVGSQVSHDPMDSGQIKKIPKHEMFNILYISYKSSFIPLTPNYISLH